MGLERSPVKFKFSKEELEALVQKLPKYKIAKLHEEKFGIPISSGLVSYWCKKWELISPPRGYFISNEFKENQE